MLSHPLLPHPHPEALPITSAVFQYPSMSSPLTPLHPEALLIASALFHSPPVSFPPPHWKLVGLDTQLSTLYELPEEFTSPLLF